MSWLWLKGEQIHCSVCEVSDVILYEDAPRMIQVGDFNVILQRELNEKYCGPGDGFEQETAAYFHVVGICESCLQHIDVNAYYIPDEDLNYVNFIEKYKRLQQSFSENTNQIISDFLMSVKGNLFDEMIKRSIETNPTTENNQRKHPNQIMSERKQYITKRLSTHFEKFDKKFSFEEKSKNDFLEFRNDVQQYLNSYLNEAVILKPYDYVNVRTLNPIISYPESRVKPIELEQHLLKFYIDYGDTLDEYRLRIVEQIDHNIRKIIKGIRKTAASKFTEVEEIFSEFEIDTNILIKERKVYECLVDGYFDQAIIQCNECGIAYRKRAGQPFERIPAGAIERVVSQHSRYVNCVCNKCYYELSKRQENDGFLEIRNLISKIEIVVIPKYKKAVKQQYQNYVSEFSEYDFEALKSGKQLSLCNDREIVEFLEKSKNKILKNADGYVRSKTKEEKNELVVSNKELYAKFCFTHEGVLGLYDLYDSDAKIKQLHVNENSFYPYKKFAYKEDYQERLDFDFSRTQEQCYGSLVEKIRMMFVGGEPYV